MPRSVSVVVPTRDRCENLPLVVEPLLGDPATREIIVVDDGSTDATEATVRSISVREPRVGYVRQENRGQAAARQVGVEVSAGDVVLMLDDDVVPTPTLATGHAGHHSAVTGAVVVGYMPVVLSTRRRPGDFATRLYSAEYEARCDVYEHDSTDVLLHLWGGNVSLRRADALRVGVWSPAFPKLYHQDREFGLRCHKAGLHGVFDRSLMAAHLHARPLDAFVRDARRQGAGRLLVHQLHEDVLGPLDGTTRPAASPLVSRTLIRGVLLWALRAAGHARLFRLELELARAVRRAEQAVGALSIAPLTVSTPAPGSRVR